jgi:hypothetical protein
VPAEDRVTVVVITYNHRAELLGAFAEALAGLPWVVRHRRVVPGPVECRLRLLDATQRRSKARHYIN